MGAGDLAGEGVCLRVGGRVIEGEMGEGGGGEAERGFVEDGGLKGADISDDVGINKYAREREVKDRMGDAPIASARHVIADNRRSDRTCCPAGVRCIRYTRRASSDKRLENEGRKGTEGIVSSCRETKRDGTHLYSTRSSVPLQVRRAAACASRPLQPSPCERQGPL